MTKTVTQAPAPNALAPVTAGQGVEVKPLEWEGGSAIYRAHMGFGFYRIESSCSEPLKYWLEHSTEDTWKTYNQDRFIHASLEAAKAAAQADYEQRIRSALATPAPKDSE